MSIIVYTFHLYLFSTLDCFRISMNMRDAATGEEIWRSNEWDPVTMFDIEIDGKQRLALAGVSIVTMLFLSSHDLTERIPKEILSCRAVSREITFSSSEEIGKFRYEWWW